ncbi:MAG: hypothetical protein WC943_04050 [Elusimicrobiota bacterium]
MSPRRSDVQRARAARIVLGGFLALFVGAFVVSAIDGRRVVEAFWEERAEQRYLKVWQRQASDVTWKECREQPDLCPGKFVVWEVSRPGGVTCFEGNCSQRIVWTNEEQVPATHGGGMIAVARIVAVEPNHLLLVFLGSPQASYGGTTQAGPAGR